MTLLLCRVAMALARAWVESDEHVVLLVNELAELQRLDNAGLPGCSSFVELGLLTSCANHFGSGSVTTIIGASTRTPLESRQFFDTELDLRHAERGSIDHRGSKLCNPPVRVEPMRTLGGIVTASAAADSLRGKNLPESDTVDALVRCGERIQRALRFDVARYLDPVEQTLCALAVYTLDGLKTSDISLFVERYVQTLRSIHGKYLEALRRDNVVTDNLDQLWFKLASELAARIRRPTLIIQGRFPR